MYISIIFVCEPSNEIARENLQMQTQKGFDPAVKFETTCTNFLRPPTFHNFVSS